MMQFAYVDGARVLQHDFLMRKKPIHGARELEENLRRWPSRGPLARNIQTLMDHAGWNQTEYARQSKVSQRHISDILRARTATTQDVLDKLAEPFGRSGFELLVDGFHEEISASSGRLGSMISAYVRNPRVRKFLDDAFELAAPQGDRTPPRR